MQIRQVKLNGGKADGLTSMASHDTAIHGGEVYVWDGGDDKDRFTHALTEVNKLPYPQRVAEARRVDEWMKHPGSPSGIKGKDGKDLMLPAPLAMCIGIPPWRVNAWMQLIRCGQVS
jgi:hypothetical protein